MPAGSPSEKAKGTIAGKVGVSKPTWKRYWKSGKKGAGLPAEEDKAPDGDTIEERAPVRNKYAYAMEIAKRRAFKTGSKKAPKIGECFEDRLDERLGELLSEEILDELKCGCEPGGCVGNEECKCPASCACKKESGTKECT